MLSLGRETRRCSVKKEHLIDATRATLCAMEKGASTACTHTNMHEMQEMAVYEARLKKKTSLSLVRYQIGEGSKFRTLYASLFVLIPLHGPSRSLRKRVCGRYEFWRTVAKAFANRRHGECEYGADGTQND